MLHFENNVIRVIKDGAYVLNGAGPALFELATTYTEAQLPRLSFTQNADVMTICHPDHDPKNINRLADDNWTLTTVSYAPTVTAPTFASADVKNITFASQAPTCVLTIIGHSFSTGNIISIAGVLGMTELNGNDYRITVVDVNNVSLDGVNSTGFGAYTSGGTATRQTAATTVGTGFGSYDKTYTYVVTAVDADGVESLPSSSASVTTKSLSTTGGVRITWGAVAGAEYYRVYKDPSNNTQIFGWIGDSNTTTFDDYNIAPLTSDAPPQDRQPFSGASDKPSAVNYYQQRQIFANTDNEPQATYTTQTGNFNSLRTSSPARDDDAVTFTIVAQQVNEIRHIVSVDNLILLTSGGEWKITEGQDEVLTPSTVGRKAQSYNGSSWVRPVIINDTVVFVQEKGARIRDLNGGDFGDKYTGNDLSIMSEHLFEDRQITDMAYADEPYGILWCVRDDGTLLGLTYLREHQVWGWHKHTTVTAGADSAFESVATISEDGRDAVYVIVKRYIDGAWVRYVERMEKRETTTTEDCFYVDSGLSYNGAPATSFSGLDHLEGEDVIVLADGYVVEGHTVSSGSITLATAASKVHVGLPYVPAIELLDIDVTSPTDTLKGKEVSVSKVIIEVEKTLGGWVGAKKDPNSGETAVFQEIKPRFVSDSYDALELKTYKQEVIIDPQWSKGGGVRIEQRAPLPMAILSVIPRVDVGGS
jgi:endo-alpha-1,4-polygalactosaminidase (GH114 family)